MKQFGSTYGQQSQKQMTVMQDSGHGTLQEYHSNTLIGGWSLNLGESISVQA